ncbi:MAG TPA: hypothetical protein VHR47_01215 [Bacillota bacterium]|nr:hypothetical protein [Bacillota bacterium]
MSILIVLLLLSVAWDVPQIIRKQRWKDLTVMLFIGLLGLMASAVLTFGFNPDFYGFLSGLFKQYLLH